MGLPSDLASISEKVSSGPAALGASLVLEPRVRQARRVRSPGLHYSFEAVPYRRPCWRVLGFQALRP